MIEKTQDKGLAIVRGGSRGIGRATCLQLAKDGYSVEVGVIQADRTSPDAERAAKTGTRIGRVGQPEALAAAISWLASAAASYVTGTVLTVSGGR